MRYLVTGASGFIGRILSVELKKRGGHVTALFKNLTYGPWDQHYCIDLGSEQLPKDILRDIDVVYHLAGIAHDAKGGKYTEQDYYRINLQASIELAYLASLSGVKHFIYFSSVKAVADPGNKCIDESWDIEPLDVYGATKNKTEKKLLELHLKNELLVTILRPALVYGVGAKGNLDALMRAIMRGYFPPLPDIQNKRSMIHVNDVVDAACLVAQNKKAYGQTYILSDRMVYTSRMIDEAIRIALDKSVQKWSLSEFSLQLAAYFGDALKSMTGYDFPLNSYSLHKILGSACYRSDKIRKELGWVSQRTFDDSVGEMVSFYKL